MAEVRLVVDGAQMARLLRGPDGPVVHHLIRLADGTIALARDLINRRRRYPERATHKLERTIVKRPTVGPEGPGMLVVAGIGLKPGYAIWVHEGNGPPGGRIYPRPLYRPDGTQRVLAFVTAGERPTDAAGWRGNPNAVIVRWVRTSRPNPFLRDALETIVGGDLLL